MHQTLRVPEILLNIFGHCSIPTRIPGKPPNYNADLAMLARTCKAFQEPALDVLWEELHDLSPLARCLPEACRLAEPQEMPEYFGQDDPCYLFSRPLKEVEWNTLRGYSRRVRVIHGSSGTLNEETAEVLFCLAPFTDPLFPHLRSLCWREAFSFAPLHLAVPSLTKLHLDFLYCPDPPVREFFDAFGNHCPHMKELVVYPQFDPLGSEISLAISRQICRWPKLQLVDCDSLTLNAHAILQFPSIPTLEWMAFILEDDPIRDVSHLASISVFPNLTYLHIVSGPLDTTTSLLRCIRLPAIKTLCVFTSGYTSRRAIQVFCAAIQKACPSNVLTCLKLDGSFRERDGVPLEVLPCLTLEDLRPFTAFAELRELDVNFDCPVSLKDADLLELVSPHTETFLINSGGWKIDVDGSGITLSGLVQLLRQCPSLSNLCLAIDTRTFTEIPEGLDVSFPPRRCLEISFVDSYIVPEFIPGLISVFGALGLDRSMLKFSGPLGWIVGRHEYWRLWVRVLDGLKNPSRKQSLSSIV